MKKLGWVGLLAFAGLLLAKGTIGAADVKIGVVDVNEVFSGYTRVAENQAEFDQFQEEQKASTLKKTEEVNQDIKSLQDKLDTQGNVLSKEQSEKITNEITEKRQELFNIQNQAIAKLREKNKEMVEARVKEIEEAIAKLAKEKGYNFIINKEAVLYSTEASDITEQVITALNKAAAKKK